MSTLKIDETQRIGIGRFLVVIFRIHLVGNQKLVIVDREGMRIQLAMLTFRVLHITAIRLTKTPTRFGLLFDKHVGRDVCD